MNTRRRVALLTAILATAAGFETAAASMGSSRPPSGRIAVVCFTPDPLADQICTFNPDGSSWKQITRGAEKIDSIDPAFSPDGKTIVFVRGPNNGRTDTYVMRADGTGARQLTHCVSCYGEDTPTYSPDGRTIAFHRDPRAGRGGIFVMKADGSRVRQLTRETCDCYDGEPSFAPDGTRLVFARYRNRDHLGALFTVHLDRSGLTRITSWALGAAFPDWSPSGKMIVFGSYGNEELRPGRSRNLYTVRPDGSGLHSLTSAKGGLEQNYQPSWSPDGNWIVFTREPNAERTPGIHGDQNVDIMRADGTEIRRIAGPPRGGHAADWGK
jgi:Tol biopolymer transport system component